MESVWRISLFPALQAVDCIAIVLTAHATCLTVGRSISCKDDGGVPTLGGNPQTATSEVFLAGENERSEKVLFNKLVISMSVAKRGDFVLGE